MRGKDHDHDGHIDSPTDHEGRIIDGDGSGEEGTDVEDTTNQHHKKPRGPPASGGSPWIVVLIILIIACIAGYLYKRYKDG